MRLIASKAFRYAGKSLEVGDEFDANDRDGRALVAVNRAQLAEGDSEKEPAPKKVTKKKTAKKRAYKRRDMQAEE